MLRCKAKDSSGEWVEFDITESLEPFDQTGLAVVYLGDTVGLYTAIDPATIQPSDSNDCYIASEQSLKDWNEPEEDAAWKSLDDPRKAMLDEIRKYVEIMSISCSFIGKLVLSDVVSILDELEAKL